MTTTFDTEQSTQTVAAAWASSPLGEPDHEVGYGFSDDTVAALTTAEELRPVRKNAIVALALAAGIGAGAAFGLYFADFTPDQPTIAVPASTSPEHAVVITETGQPAVDEVLDVLAPTTVAPANTAPAGTVGGPKELTDIRLPDPSAQPEPPTAQEEPKSEAPQDPAPQDPGPQDPAPANDELPQPYPHPAPPVPEIPNPWVPGDLDIANDNPLGPDPAPEFEPPIVLPSQQPEPPSIPDLDISDKAGS
jgi:hypothetical protein